MFWEDISSLVLYWEGDDIGQEVTHTLIAIRFFKHGNEDFPI
jgi:hypothetical protein